MVFHIGHQLRQTFALMVAGATVMDSAARACNRVGTGTICRQPEPGHLRVSVHQGLTALARWIL